MKRLALSAFLLMCASCQAPDTVMRTMAPYEPMLLGTAYTGVFSGSFEDTSGSYPIGETPFYCPLTVARSGVAADYCGFVVTVFEDKFSFDAAKPREENPWFGAYSQTFEGEGNDEGAELKINGEFIEGDLTGYWWEYNYIMTHTGQ